MDINPSFDPYWVLYTSGCIGNYLNSTLWIQPSIACLRTVKWPSHLSWPAANNIIAATHEKTKFSYFLLPKFPVIQLIKPQRAIEPPSETEILYESVFSRVDGRCPKVEFPGFRGFPFVFYALCTSGLLRLDIHFNVAFHKHAYSVCTFTLLQFPLH